MAVGPSNNPCLAVNTTVLVLLLGTLHCGTANTGGASVPSPSVGRSLRMHTNALVPPSPRPPKDGTHQPPSPLPRGPVPLPAIHPPPPLPLPRPPPATHNSTIPPSTPPPTPPCCSPPPPGTHPSPLPASIHALRLTSHSAYSFPAQYATPVLATFLNVRSSGFHHRLPSADPLEKLARYSGRPAACSSTKPLVRTKRLRKKARPPRSDSESSMPSPSKVWRGWRGSVTCRPGPLRK